MEGATFKNSSSIQGEPESFLGMGIGKGLGMFLQTVPPFSFLFPPNKDRARQIPQAASLVLGKEKVVLKRGVRWGSVGENREIQAQDGKLPPTHPS